jgi:hypothetical protein
MPAGESGAKRWTEKWLVNGCGKHYPVDVEFSEDGPNAANWTIQNKSASTRRVRPPSGIRNPFQ